ncbi:uncharacterized protein LOC133188115 [Saccostrea echinata]|uniref:uncharacterized protein LOC133188115 n=1 Tax=Saccostrea echinata TaxID=191078 RepID=UPI002A83B5C5|nr:uncharacterized protein LOC133188115 [Saccostrea echinata]
MTGEDQIIRRVDRHGFIIDNVKTTRREFPDVNIVTRQGDLMHSVGENGTVKIVRQERTEVMLTTPKGFKPREPCRTESGDILVNLHNEKRNKIVRYQGETVKEDIYKDDSEKDIVKNGDDLLLLYENNN